MTLTPASSAPTPPPAPRCGPKCWGVLWPLVILGAYAEPPASLPDALTPDTAEGIRATFRPIFERGNPQAVTGLDLCSDAELVYWGRVFRGPVLTGHEDELLFMPAWLWKEGVFLSGLARLLTLPLFERFDVFLEAMHQRGAA